MKGRIFLDGGLVREDRVTIDPKECAWLCAGCGSKKAMVGAKAFPLCGCGMRMTMISSPRLNYVEDGR